MTTGVKVFAYLYCSVVLFFLAFALGYGTLYIAQALSHLAGVAPIPNEWVNPTPHTIVLSGVIGGIEMGAYFLWKRGRP